MDLIADLARVPRRPPRSDFVIAGGLALWGLLEAVLAHGPGSRALRVAFALVITVPLVVRRRAPLTVTCVIAAASVARILTADTPETGMVPFPSLLLMTFSVALYARHTAGAVAGGLITFGVMLLAITWTKYDNNGTPTATNYTILVFFIGGAWLAGWLVRRRAAQARTAIAHSDELARSAVADERARIARELHDVVAHSVSIIAVQAGAAEALLERDPDAARGHMRAVRRTAREAMTEMRRLLDVLRTDEPRYAPTPGLSRLDDLVAETRSAGVAVELSEDGSRPELPAGVDLVAFRIVQEALTNARKHARGAPVTVALRYSDDAVEIEVRNALLSAVSGNGRANRAGHGLIGMRERALLFGGSFAAGVRDGTSPEFRVHAVLPLGEAAA